MEIHWSWTLREGNWAAIHEALVSLSSPMSNSVPMENISAFNETSLISAGKHMTCPDSADG
jgi:hypothetical protein